MLRIEKVAEKLGVGEDYLEYYGRYTAKLRLDLLARAEPKGKLILVTAVTPTSHGEGKTTVSIGLTQGLQRWGRNAVVTLREPSLGPMFGLKGGATGGGRSQVLPSEKINLHFNGDFHAVAAAQNLLAALIDAHLHHGNELGLDVHQIHWPRALDLNDRALRKMIVGLGGASNGIPRETDFVITAASEVMAILALAHDREDLRRRLGDIVVGFSREGQPLRARDFRATGAMMVLLHEAVMPNLVQTTEGAPALVHTGPFANIAHGTSSVIAQRMALNLADYVVNETGFGTDLGAEKFFDIVMPDTGLTPDLVVLVASVRALCAQGAGGRQDSGDLTSLRKGLVNLGRHIDILEKFHVPVVVAINRFPGDTEEMLHEIAAYSRARGLESAVVDPYARGGEGAMALAENVITACQTPAATKAQSLYSKERDLLTKIETVAREVYGAGGVYVETEARRKLQRLEKAGFGRMPVCMAKTQFSLTDNPKMIGAPTGWTLTVSDVCLAAGAGYVVVTAGQLLRMPGLGKEPQALRMEVTKEGEITGLG